MAQCSHQSFKMFSAPALNSRIALELSILSLANFSRLRCVSKTLSSSRPRSRTQIIRVCVNRRSRVRVRHLELGPLVKPGCGPFALGGTVVAMSLWSLPWPVAGLEGHAQGRLLCLVASSFTLLEKKKKKKTQQKIIIKTIAIH